MKTLEDLLNKKCKLPGGQIIRAARMNTETDPQGRLLRIELLVAIPGPDGTAMNVPINFVPR